MINCTSGKIMDASINAGERKNLRISRSTMAIIRFMTSTPQFGFRRSESGSATMTSRKPRAENPKPRRSSWLQPRPLRHHKGIRFLQFVAQLSPGVVHKDVVEGSVLHGERFQWNSAFHRHLDQFRGGTRT